MVRKYVLPLAALVLGLFAVIYVVGAQKVPPDKVMVALLLMRSMLGVPPL